MREKLFTKGEKIIQDLETQFLKSRLRDDQELMKIAKKVFLQRNLNLQKNLTKLYVSWESLKDTAFV